MPTYDQIIDEIEGVRKSNNVLWMDILRVAMRSDPKATKDLLSQINRNDSRIGVLIGLLST